MITDEKVKLAYNTLREYCQKNMNCAICPIVKECNIRDSMGSMDIPCEWPKLEDTGETL